jgi:hypothetical protein
MIKTTRQKPNNSGMAVVVYIIAGDLIALAVLAVILMR